MGPKRFSHNYDPQIHPGDGPDTGRLQDFVNYFGEDVAINGEQLEPDHESFEYDGNVQESSL